MHASTHQASLALAAFNRPQATLHPITVGHINATFRVEAADGLWVLQQVNPMFVPAVNTDIAAIVPHLHAAHITAPVLQQTDAGALWHTDSDGGVWRLMTFIPGHVHLRCTHAHQAATTGHLLGRFHRALQNVSYTFCAPRFGVHDTPKHIAGLQAALGAHSNHPAYDRIAPLAEAILSHSQSLPPLHAGAGRIVHGDPKISNFIFNDAQQAHALIDLDTLAVMPVALEIGDALRSWCSPGGEDPALARFELDHFAAALTGYKQGAQDFLSPDEVAQVAPSLGVIATELAARFARDAFEERYFGWDTTAYSRAWEHNLARAQSQWRLVQSFAAQRDEAQAAVERVFGLTL